MARKKKDSIAITDAALTEELARFRVGAQHMLDWAADCPLKTQVDVDAADVGLQRIHAAGKLFAVRKDELTAPHEKVLNGLLNAIAPIEECLASCKETLKKRLLARNAEAKAVLDTAIAEGDYAISHAAPVVSAALTESRYWTYEIVDLADVPREWLTLDHGKVMTYVRAKGRDAEIPGLRMVEKTRGSVKA